MTKKVNVSAMKKAPSTIQESSAKIALSSMIKVGGVDIEFSRKRIKAMHIHVKSGSGKVIVTAPLFVDFAKVEAFVLLKIDWIKATQEKMTSKIKQPILKYIDGEMVNAFGVDYKLVIFYNDNLKAAKEYVATRALEGKIPLVSENRLVFLPRTMVLVTNRGSSTAEREKFVTKRLEDSLLKLAAQYVSSYEKQMAVKVESVIIKKLSGCWGKCSVKTAQVWLNRNLAKCPPRLVEYIVVHEMCHLIVPNHSAEFKALMTKFFPDWKKVNVELNRYSFD